MAQTTTPKPPETPADLAALATQLVQDLRGVRERIRSSRCRISRSRA